MCALESDSICNPALSLTFDVALDTLLSFPVLLYLPLGVMTGTMGMLQGLNEIVFVHECLVSAWHIRSSRHI